MKRGLWAAVAVSVLSAVSFAADVPANGVYDVRAFGAKGDGTTLDSPAINQAIETAASNGGGQVRVPAGNYLSTSIHLKSNIALYLDQGAVIVAADPKDGFKYDPPEENPENHPDPKKEYQDYGHSHFHNSLIWGERLENVSILGPGKIWGKGLVRSMPRKNPKSENASAIPNEDSGQGAVNYNGIGNKAVVLKLCRNVILRDFTIQHGGWFGILATGVDNCTIDNLKIDTNRDGMDLDCCRNVRVSNCSVNSPFDDGICPKSSFALGEFRPCENITITNCQVSGYDEGSFLDGTFKRDVNKYSHKSPTGRIKCGTESNGGFKNITISNCVFEYCRGLAFEAVDGALCEDITVSNITMRDIGNAPIFLRLGARMRGPAGTPVGAMRRIIIDNVVCYNATDRQGVLISGLPEHPIEDIRLSNIHIYYKGGGDEKWAATQTAEQETGYPEPDNFGPLPAYGCFVRHVKNFYANDIQITSMKPDPRPPFVMIDVKGVDMHDIRAQHGEGVEAFKMTDVDGVTARHVEGLPDRQ
jgi:polygalacturonase